MGFTEFVKHMRYKSLYKPNELYWGLGIEEETYMQFTKPINVAAPILHNCHNPERYSVDYYKSYKPSYLTAIYELFPDESGFFALPYYMNSHAFIHMDSSGNHITTYEKVPNPNPKFNGMTFFESLKNFIPKKELCCSDVKIFTELFNKHCIFDGDSIEFMTQKFYKAKVNTVIDELVTSKKDLLKSINTFLIEKKMHRDKGLLMYPEVNSGFAVFYSNPKNIAMFNNGTYHINITLPTLLGDYDANGIPRIVDIQTFNYDHKKYIRFVQWLEPFIIGVYGTADPLSRVSEIYSKASQRCAISRYIGIGTYNTTLMTPGKILTQPIEQIRGSDTEFWWYKKYHSESGYEPLKEIGMDINFRKHYNHGVEIRFIDWFPEKKLKELMEFYVYLADLSIIGFLPTEAVMSELWNELVVDILRNGKNCIVSGRTLEMYEFILSMSLKEGTLENVFGQICAQLKHKRGVCAKYML